MKKVFVNDSMLTREEAHVDLEDRGYQFGDGVYEVIRVYEGKMFTANEHLDRLFVSAKKIKLTIPYEKNQLMEMLNQLIVENDLHDGTIYMQITRGTARRNHVFPGEEVEAVLTAYTNEVPRPELALKQ